MAHTIRRRWVEVSVPVGINAALANPKLATENDAEEYGKGHEFPTATFKTAWDVSATLEKYLSAEIGAWAV